jgi:hypothetical protein
MLQLAGSDQVRVVVGPHVLSVEQTEIFAHALLRLAASAHLAEPGLGFVEVLADQSGASLGELALASGLELDRLRAQRAGGQVLNRREYDRLALAAAELLHGGRRVTEPVPSEAPAPTAAQSLAEALADVATRAAAPVAASEEPAQHDGSDVTGLADVADLHQLVAMSAERS